MILAPQRDTDTWHILVDPGVTPLTLQIREVYASA
jgi:hypothetical protein